MMSDEKIIEIDGSYLEGGGQILRNALSLSCILKCPIRIKNIRANRPNPGLSHQHLFGLNLLGEITNAKILGNILKSTEVEFYPGDIKSGKYSVDTRTAASLTLVLQGALPVLIFGDKVSELELIGGTNVSMAPQIDFMTEIFRPNLERFGATFDFDLLKRGYYPKGRGRCKIEIETVSSLKAATINEFGKLLEISGWCYVAGSYPRRLADEMKSAVAKELSAMDNLLFIEAYKEEQDIARDNGAGVILRATTSQGCILGTDALGDKHFVPADLGRKAAVDLREMINKKVCVDNHVQDQLIIFMALSHGTSQILTNSLTDHTCTAIHVVQLMLPEVKFTTENRDDGLIQISCVGVGHRNKYR